MRNIRFVENLKKYLLVSGAVFALIILGILVFGVQLDIQFKGGSIVTYAYDGTLDKNEFERVAQDLTENVISIQQSTDLASGLETMVLTLPGTRSMTSEQLVEVTGGLEAAFPENNLRTVAINNVNPTIGKEFFAKSLWAVALAAVLIVLFTALRFKKIGGLSAGAMGVLALVHDVIIVFGVFVLLRYPLDDNFIAVVLTILGFSINDTIVIYDRIRENKRLLGPKTNIAELVNLSINQTLTRSINVSLTAVLAMTVVAVLAFVYNVEPILTFAIPLLVGLVAGAYSSVCIAGPLWVKWQERKLKAL